MKPKVLKTEADYHQALARVEALMDARPGTAKEAELELWSVLLEKYEEKEFPMDPPDPVEAIRFRMDQMGLKPADLIPIFRTKSRVSEVLSHKRPLSLAMIRALSADLLIPAAILVREPPKRVHPPKPSPSSRKRPSLSVRTKLVPA